MTEIPCPNDDHCAHWEEGDDCCRCPAKGLSRAEMISQGMIDESDEEWAVIVWGRRIQQRVHRDD